MTILLLLLLWNCYTDPSWPKCSIWYNRPWCAVFWNGNHSGYNRASPWMVPFISWWPYSSSSDIWFILRIKGNPMVCTTSISVGPSALAGLPPTLRNTDKKAWSRTPYLCRWYTTLHLYQTYINQRVVDEGVANLENCLTNIYTWMSQNKLKLNADKTEVLVMGTPQVRKFPFVVLP